MAAVIHGHTVMNVPGYLGGPYVGVPSGATRPELAPGTPVLPSRPAVAAAGLWMDWRAVHRTARPGCRSPGNRQVWHHAAADADVASRARRASIRGCHSPPGTVGWPQPGNDQVARGRPAM